MARSSVPRWSVAVFISTPTAPNALLRPRRYCDRAAETYDVFASPHDRPKGSGAISVPGWINVLKGLSALVGTIRICSASYS